mmetsp:Transcript_20301/g.68120  ORF Transcript_20301/g.68120 Transcript_20301/m.68120 type:complete len:142 (+) Transcript_20301:39-464(+)
MMALALMLICADGLRSAAPLARTALRPSLTPRPVRMNEGNLYGREPLVLTWDNVERVVEEAQTELGTIFGSSQENQDIGLTGALELVDIEGPTVIVSLSGTFWHSLDRVQPRVDNYIRTRIPECADVQFDNDEECVFGQSD